MAATSNQEPSERSEVDLTGDFALADDPGGERPASPEPAPHFRWRRMVHDLWSLLAPPAEWLQRVRRAFLLVSLIAVVLALQIIGVTGSHEQLWAAVGFPSLIWLACRWIQEYRRRTTSPFWDCADGLALLGVSATVERLDSASGLAFLLMLYSSLAFRSLSVSGYRVTIGVLVYHVVYLTSLALNQTLTASNASSLIGLMQFPGFSMIGAAGYLLATTLARRDEDAARHGLLMRTVTDLMVAGDRGEAAMVAARAAASCCHDGSCVVAVVASGTERDLAVQAVAGRDAGRLAGIRLRVDRLPEPTRHRIHGGALVELSGASVDQTISTDEPSGSWPYLAIAAIEPVAESLVVLCILSEHPLSSQCKEDLGQLVPHLRKAWRQAESNAQLRQRESAFRSLVLHSSDAITVLSADFKIMYQTPVFGQIVGFDERDIIGASLLDLVHPDDLAAVIQFLEALSDGEQDAALAEWRLRCADGSWLPLETTGTNLLGEPQVDGLLLSSRDVRDRKLLEERLLHQAFHDPLTGLPNRTLFLQQLEAGLSRPLRRSVSLAVMFLDLDRFKTINDSLGHDAGDQLLRTIAERLRECVRGEDLVARLGGDEFAILLDDIIDDVPAVEIAERILHRMSDLIELDGHEIYVTTSIGIALGSALNNTPDSMLRNADVAMYEAKRQGRAGYVIFTQDMNAHALERLTLESELRCAIRNNQLEVHYQPLVSIETGRVQEVEALVRWNHPRLGLLAPSAFITLAEETGLILPIGEWVLQQASSQVHIWQRRNPQQSLALSVNLSARQFQQPGLVGDIASVLADSGLDPRSLKIEITESVAMIDQYATIAMLRELRRLGVRLAIDDFGIGYSSLSSLKHFPVDALKIDRSFVAGLGQDQGDTAIVSAVIAFAKALELSVTAEGVETVQQLLRLRALKCDQGQGYLFAQPLVQDALEPLLNPAGMTGYHASREHIRRVGDVDLIIEQGVAD